MEHRKSTRKGLYQNIAIVVLSVSALLLFTQTQLSPLGQLQLSGLLNDAVDLLPTGTSAEALTQLSAPVHVAVTGAYGRYGSLRMTTGDDSFSALGTLLGEAIGSAGQAQPCSSEEFRTALSEDSVYCDFAQPLPLELLGGLLGANSTLSTLSVRALLLSTVDAETAGLFLWDGESLFYRASTAVSVSDLQRQTSQYQLGNAYFAFELDGAYRELAPLTLLISDMPELPAATITAISPNEDQLLPALGFNPHTGYRYPEEGGTQVIVESNQTLRLQPDGGIQYQNDGDSLLQISAADTIPTAGETVSGVYQLLTMLLNGQSGDAALYLRSYTRSGTVTELTFGYQINGIPVYPGNTSTAASVTLNGAGITALTLSFRQYTLTESTGRLLPLTQAVAIAASYPEAQLTLGYTDGSDGSLTPNWLLQ